MENFNPYLEKIDLTYWRDLCQREGRLRHYEAGEFFLEAGKVARFMGYVQSGSLKYTVNDSEGNEHVINLEPEGGFASDFPNSL